MTTITRAQRAAALAAAQDAPDAAAALRAIADAWGVTLPEPEPSEEMWTLAQEITRKAKENGCGNDPALYALATLQFAAEKAKASASAYTLGEYINLNAFLASIGAGHAR